MRFRPSWSATQWDFCSVRTADSSRALSASPIASNARTQAVLQWTALAFIFRSWLISCMGDEPISLTLSFRRPRVSPMPPATLRAGTWPYRVAIVSMIARCRSSAAAISW